MVFDRVKNLEIAIIEWIHRYNTIRLHCEIGDIPRSRKKPTGTVNTPRPSPPEPNKPAQYETRGGSHTPDIICTKMAYSSDRLGGSGITVPRYPLGLQLAK